jgi:hypothetical protein
MAKKGIDDLCRIDNGRHIETRDATKKQNLRHDKASVPPKSFKRFTVFNLQVIIIIMERERQLGHEEERIRRKIITTHRILFLFTHLAFEIHIASNLRDSICHVKAAQRREDADKDNSHSRWNDP